MIKVSVIMPVYNSERYLSTALESVLEQTLKEIEIICVDDGSTDASLKILQKYQKLDNRIKILKQKNSYAGTARNTGMSVASGQYLSFLDSDDYFSPEMLEKAYLNAVRQDADVVIFGGEQFINDLNRAVPYPSLLKEDLLPDGEGFDNKEKLDSLMLITTPSPWNKLFRHDFIKEHHLKFQPYKRVNDAYFVEIAIANADRIGILRENLIFYRTGNKKSLQGTNGESPKHFAKVFFEIQQELQKCGLYSKVEKSFRNLCLSNCIYNLEGLHDGDAFEILYNALKKYIFNDFYIVGTTKDDYYNTYAYEQYLYIMTHSPVEYWMKKYEIVLQKGGTKQYLFPFGRVKQGSRIILYGGGQVGRTFYRQIKKSEYCLLKEWVDQKVQKYNGFILCQPEHVKWHDCDAVVLAVEQEKTAKQILETLVKEFGVSSEKLIWENPLI